MNEKLLDAGDGNDIVTDISQREHIIKGGKGNNIIFINQLNGHIKIINSGGKDTIILQDKKIADYQIVDHNGNRSYLSSDSLSGILIEDYEQQNITVKAGIGLNEPLNNEQINGLIDFMAAFDNKSENSSIDLITYLSTFNVEADFSVATTL
ncbi:hypothetical protein [Arsenophonus sp. PmNCSU2021_1]|uniref:hypothetical protein n=1 Tax=Arsenophonus sp. PmNCSU2021_1 TaxID=3118989 RepID=UPI002FEF39B6